MGAVYSLDDQLDSAGQQSVVNTLSKCTLDSVSVAYDQLLIKGLPGEDTTICPATIALILPLPISIATALVNLLKDAKANTICIWDCFNVLTFFACGSADVRIRLFYTVHGWGLEGVDQLLNYETLEWSLLRLVHAVHRVYQADPWIQISGSGDGVCDVHGVTTKLMNEIQQVAAGCQPDFNHLHKWLQLSQSACFPAYDMSRALRRSHVEHTLNDKTLSGSSPCSVRYTWVQVACDEGRRTPSCRSKHAVAVHNGYIYLYGGRDGYIGHKDLWRFEIASNAWEQMKCSGDRPFLLQEHTMIAYNGKLYVFGGEFSSSWSHEAPLWTLDLARGAWVRPRVDGEVAVPCGRRAHTAVITNHQMHIYGGFLDLKGSSSELWTFDLEHEMWHLCYRADGSGDEGPGSRHGHSAVVHDNAMWVYGGMSDLTPRSDLWRWHFKLQSWTKFKIKNGPPPLAGHSACKIPSGMLIYGGECGGVIQTDIWKFTFSSQTWQRLLCDGLTPSPRSQHCVVVLPSFLLQQAWLASSNDRSLSVPLLKQVTAPEPSLRSKSNPAFRNSVSPANLHTEAMTREPCELGTKLPTKDSSSSKVIDKFGCSPKSCDMVTVLGTYVQNAHTEVDACRTNQKVGDKVCVEGRAEELRCHIRQMQKTKSLDSVSLCRLLSSTSDSSDEWLEYDNCLNISGHTADLNPMGDEGSPVKRQKGHGLVKGQCLRTDTGSLYLKSASVESILSMTHNTKLPPPHWLNYKVRSRTDITNNSMASTFRSQSWDSLLRSFGGVGLSCTEIDVRNDPKAVEMTNMLNSADDLVIEDLEDCTSDLSFAGDLESVQQIETRSSSRPQFQYVSMQPSYNVDHTSHAVSNAWSSTAHEDKENTSLPDLVLDVSDSIGNSSMDNRPSNVQSDIAQRFLGNGITRSKHVPMSIRGREKMAVSNDIELVDFSQKEGIFRQSHDVVFSCRALKQYLAHMGVRTCDTVHMYVFGGKESESRTLGTKPLPVWRLDIHEPTIRKHHVMKRK